MSRPASELTIRRENRKANSLPFRKRDPAFERHVRNVKRRIAFLVVIGASKTKIRRELALQGNLDRYLEHPEVLATIPVMEQALRDRHERRYLQLFPQAIDAMARRLEGRVPKKGSVRVSLEDIKFVFHAFGRDGELAGQTSAGAPIMNQNVFIHGPDDAQAAIELLKRDRQERQKQRPPLEIPDAIESGRTP